MPNGFGLDFAADMTWLTNRWEPRSRRHHLRRSALSGADVRAFPRHFESRHPRRVQIAASTRDEVVTTTPAALACHHRRRVKIRALGRGQEVAQTGLFRKRNKLRRMGTPITDGADSHRMAVDGRRVRRPLLPSRSVGSGTTAHDQPSDSTSYSPSTPRRIGSADYWRRSSTQRTRARHWLTTLRASDSGVGPKVDPPDVPRRPLVAPCATSQSVPVPDHGS